MLREYLTLMSNATPSATKPAAKFSETDAAALLGCNVKQARSRLAALGYVKACGRCGGSGRYSFNQMDGDRCFGCLGCGKVLLPITRKLVADALVKIEAGGLVAYFARIETIRAARAAFAPLMVELCALYTPIADAYTAASRSSHDAAAFVASWLFRVNSVAGDIRWGGQRGRPRTVRLMGAGEIESAIKFGDITHEEAAREMAERVEMMRAVRAAFDAGA